jgi:hypothetical protein
LYKTHSFFNTTFFADCERAYKDYWSSRLIRITGQTNHAKLKRTDNKKNYYSHPVIRHVVHLRTERTTPAQITETSPPAKRRPHNYFSKVINLVGHVPSDRTIQHYQE